MSAFKILVLSFFFISPFALADAKSIDLLYSGGNFQFANVQIKITPYNKGLHYDSTGGKRYSMDCNDTKNPGEWRCMSPCGSGPLTLQFSKTKGFGSFKIESLNITPRLCDGSASKLDKPVKIKKPMVFKLKKVAKEFQYRKKK